MTAVIQRSIYTISILAVFVFVLEPLVNKDVPYVVAHYVPILQTVRTLLLHILYKHIHHFSLYA